MKKLTEAELKARTIPATVPPEKRAQVIKEAANRVRAKASIDFRRELRD